MSSLTVPHYTTQPDGSETEYEVTGSVRGVGHTSVLEIERVVCLGPAQYAGDTWDRPAPMSVDADDVFGADDLDRIRLAILGQYAARAPDPDDGPEWDEDGYEPRGAQWEVDCDGPAHRGPDRVVDLHRSLAENWHAYLEEDL